MAIVVFADGASSGNPGPGGWGAIVVVEAQQVRELGAGASHTTNNQMELSAAIAALRWIRENRLGGHDIQLHTDSTYVIRGITQWVHAWRRNGWKTAEGKDVLNRGLWEELLSEIEALRKSGSSVQWKHVAGHAGIAGNERADEIAVAFRDRQTPVLFQGGLQDYAVAVLDLTADPQAEKAKKKTAPAKGAGPSYYLSLVGNDLARHPTWAECEARVKGVSGARYKKVSSLQEEKETLSGWGIKPPLA